MSLREEENWEPPLPLPPPWVLWNPCPFLVGLRQASTAFGAGVQGKGLVTPPPSAVAFSSCSAAHAGHRAARGDHRGVAELLDEIAALRSALRSVSSASQSLHSGSRRRLQQLGEAPLAHGGGSSSRRRARRRSFIRNTGAADAGARDGRAEPPKFSRCRVRREKKSVLHGDGSDFHSSGP